MATALPRPSLSSPTSPYEPPSSALPPLPVPKTRKSLPPLPGEASNPSLRSISSPHTPSKLRTPSKPAIPIPSIPKTLQQVSSTPSVPTLKSLALKSNEASTSERPVRKSVSIAALPHPSPDEKGASRIGRPSLPSSNLSAGSSDSPTALPKASSSEVGAESGSAQRKLKKTISSGGLRSAYMGGSPSLLNGTGDSVAIAAPKKRPSLASSVLSEANSRTSSAQGSHSTNFEDLDDVTQRPRSESKDEMSGRRSRSKSNKGNVVVSVRVRPNGSSDHSTDAEWMVDGRQNLVAYRGKEGGNYVYDNVFSPHDGNAKLYEVAAKRLVRRVMEGYHGTVFAYGMTGTGKTFSMQGTSTQPGIIPQAVADIFSYIRETPHREFLLRTSYLEIYNEDIRDLLAPPAPGAQPDKIQLREDKKRGVYASPVKEEIVQSPMQLLRVISRGDRYRHTSSTQYNIHSSRSHAVVKIVVESRERASADGSTVPGGVRVSSLCMIDLAGSERAAENKERRTEGSHINKSLLTLGTVIARLNKDKGPNAVEKDDRHLPYRDSKLTRLLQPALQGNSLISILCTIQIGSTGSVATAQNHTYETLNTLKFAARAKNNIVSHAKRAEEAHSGADPNSIALLDRYRREISALRNELQSTAQSQAKAEEELQRTREQQEEREADERHGDQMIELQLARTALKERIEHLNRLILSSQSLGVNSSSGGLGDKLAGSAANSIYGASSIAGTRSIRSSASLSTLQRASSVVSQNTISTHLASLRNPSTQPEQGFDSNEADYDDSTGDGIATLQAQNKALQADLTDKNHYIATLEKRLIQARRSSQARTSLGVTISQLQEKDTEITELRRQLSERDRTISNLRAAAAATAILPPPPVPNSEPAVSAASTPVSTKKHHASDSYGTSSSATTSNSAFSAVEVSAKELAALRAKPTSAPPDRALPQLPAKRASNDSGKSSNRSNTGKPARSSPPQQAAKPVTSSHQKTQTIDELSQFLDGIIEDKVQRGEIDGLKVPSRHARKGSRGSHSSQRSQRSQRSLRHAAPSINSHARGLSWDDDASEPAQVQSLNLGLDGVST